MPAHDSPRHRFFRNPFSTNRRMMVEASGPLLTVGVLATIELINQFTTVVIPNPSAIYFTAVLYSSFVGGVRIGLVSAFLTIAYAVVFYSMPGTYFQYEADNAVRLVVLTLTTPAMVIMVGLLQQALRTSADRFRALTDAAPDAVITMNDEGGILYVNRAAQRIFGYRADELVGSNASMLLPERHRREVGGFDWFTDRSPSMGKTAELVGRRRNGEEFPIEVSVSRWQSNINTFHTAIIRDITVRKRALQELEHVTSELRRSNAELQQFAYVASHDLQEPLRMVASYCQLLQDRYAGKLDPDADEFIRFAVDGATRMQKLIQDLLTYSRVSSKEIQPTPVPLEAALAEALSNLRATITEKEAVVTHDPLPIVSADRVHMIQLLQNLIGNALKFGGASSPRVHVSAKNRGDEWLFSVRDNGVGIDPRFHDRIFTLFQRLHGAEYPGTGIGLSVCRRIVERHGGRIWVESEPGKGATFFWTVPGDRARWPETPEVTVASAAA